MWRMLVMLATRSLPCLQTRPALQEAVSIILTLSPCVSEYFALEAQHVNLTAALAVAINVCVGR